MKGQLNLEYLAGAFLFVSTLAAIIFLGIGGLPSVSATAEERALNLRAEQMTTRMLTNTGRFNSGASSGTRWDEHVQHVTSFGLAEEFLEVSRDKIMELETVGEKSFNYSQFKTVTGADQQYRFRFTWRPTVPAFKTFRRFDPPSKITEPSSGPRCCRPYNLTANTVHYGSETLNGTEYYFLVTSRDGRYNGTYVTTEEWDFQGHEPVGEGEQFSRVARDESFVVQEIDNRGNLIVLSQRLKTFGASRNENSRTVKLNRYASMDSEPLLLEVWTW